MVTLTKYCFLLSNQRVAGSGFGELASASGGQQRARTLSKLSGKKRRFVFSPYIMGDGRIRIGGNGS